MAEKYIHRYPPCPAYETRRFERWLEDMAKDDVTSVTCHFCDKGYNFTSKDMLNLAKRASE